MDSNFCITAPPTFINQCHWIHFLQPRSSLIQINPILPVRKSPSSMKSWIIFLLKFIWRFFPPLYNLPCGLNSAVASKITFIKNFRCLSLIEMYKPGKGIWWRLTKVGGTVIQKFDSILQFGGFRNILSSLDLTPALHTFLVLWCFTPLMGPFKWLW